MIIINMGGEMVYILEQRLQAQNVPDEKAKRGESLDSNENDMLHPA